MYLIVTFSWVLAYRWVNPPLTLLMASRSISARFDGQPWQVSHQWVPYEDVSPYLTLSFIAAEDQNFPFHRGFDWAALQKAWEHNQTSERTIGGSTISQQVAKNVFLWESRTWLRKGLETYFTALIEMLWPKERILEVYLNVVELGPLTFGVEAASHRYFHKSAHNLTLEQAALLAVVLPSPLKYNAARPTAYLIKRKNWTMRQVKMLGGKQYLQNI